MRRTLDRIVATVGDEAITQSDVETAARFERFQDGQMPEGLPDSKSFEQSLQRLIDQRLLTLEAQSASMDREGLPAAATGALEDIRKKFPDDPAYRVALRSLGMDEQQVLDQLSAQIFTLRLIDQRLRPAAWVEPAEIERYYQNTFLPEHARQGAASPPALNDVLDQIREIIIQKKIDQLLGDWLEELRASQHVRLLTGNVTQSNR